MNLIIRGFLCLKFEKDLIRKFLSEDIKCVCLHYFSSIYNFIYDNLSFDIIIKIIYIHGFR